MLKNISVTGEEAWAVMKTSNEGDGKSRKWHSASTGALISGRRRGKCGGRKKINKRMRWRNKRGWRSWQQQRSAAGSQAAAYQRMDIAPYGENMA